MFIWPIPWRSEAKVESVELVPLDFLGELGLVMNGLELALVSETFMLRERPLDKLTRLQGYCLMYSRRALRTGLTNQVDEKIRCLFGLSKEKHSRLGYVAYVISPRVVFPAYWAPPACRREKTRSHRRVLSQETYQYLLMRSKSCMLRCCHDSVFRYHLDALYVMTMIIFCLDYPSFSSLILLICSVFHFAYTRHFRLVCGVALPTRAFGKGALYVLEGLISSTALEHSTLKLIWRELH